mmetsp:Transcript_19810/g.33321  ORF Transcript_19810/g.33321 Transcript_19810/m.33321 type:complete len:692 (+) Transcript_19810:81-2156(+)
MSSLLSGVFLCCIVCVCVIVLASPVTAGKVTDLHTALFPESLDIEAATQLVSTLDSYDINIPIYGDRPLLHHALNLYFMHQNPHIRASLVRFMLALVDRHVDINAPYNSDPDVLFKTVVIRELGLAKALAAGGGVTNNSLSLTQLYSVPCDPIPLSKLLLHAHSVVQSRVAEAAQMGRTITVEQVQALLAGASLGAGAKAAAKAGDLAEHSSSFRGLMTQMLPEKREKTAVDVVDSGFSLQSIINSLGELGSTVHEHLLRNFLDASADTVTGLGHLANLLATFDKKGRNPLHTLAMSGGSALVRDLVQVFSALDQYKSKRARRVRGKLAVALTTADIRGHSPVAYASLRYGPESDVYAALRELATLAQADLDEVLLEFLFKSHERHEPSGEQQERRGVDAADGGGWSDAVLDPVLRGDPERCDILEVWVGQPEPVDFFVNYVALGKPVVFRGAMQHMEARGETSIRAALNRKQFLQKYGRESIAVSTIPYASSFGVGVHAMSLRDVADLNVSEASTPPQQTVDDGSSDGVLAGRDSGQAGDDGVDEPPLYAFSTASPAWREQIEDDIGLPALLEGGGLLQDVEMQFYLGPMGTGAPMHYHGHAVNSLAYGEKQWFLLPPGRARYSKTPSLQYVKALREQEQSKTGDNLPLQCTQRAGDLMFVPTLWGHATLNTKQCIGVAHEFSVDDICME